MALQSVVGLYRAAGVAGDKATPNQSVYFPLNLFADASGVVAGTFVWQDSNGDATNTKGTGKPLGLVERNLSYPNYDVLSGASMLLKEGEAPMIAVKGDYYVTTTTTATVGQKVFALADGTIATAAAGGTVSGGVETDWKVLSAGATGELILISNWSE